jgi:L-amino acid N-acyltransferase YncA
MRNFARPAADLKPASLPSCGDRDVSDARSIGEIRIRAAALRDADAVAAIYNEGIEGRGATFETAERSPDDVRRWFGSTSRFQRPFLVAERTVNGVAEVVGWVRASEYRPRGCYDGVAEFSVYVAASARGQRVGDVLMSRFVEACAASGIWKLLSRIFPENTASRALCARHGFREVGVYVRHAQLDGVWRDVVIVERLIPENQLA